MSAFPKQDTIDAAVRELHASPWMAMIATTGAAGGLREDLWRTPGASNTILGLHFLYDQRELSDFIRHEPSQYCSAETALRMAAAAYAKARRRVIERGQKDRPVVGVGMTAAVNPGDRPKKGEHRVFIAAKTDGDIRLKSVVFEKGRLTREEEGRACDLLTLDAALRSAIQQALPEFLPAIGARSEIATIPSTSASRDGQVLLIDGKLATLADLSADRHVIYPGSYAPLHHGHEQVAEMVETMTGRQVVFQLTASHPSKGPIPPDELARRIDQFRFRWQTLVLEKDGLYLEKARRLPGFDFVVGADAVLGLLDTRYYGGKRGLTAALDELSRLKTTFYVVGRVIDGDYLALEDIPVPERYRHIFRAVSGRWDISSSALRA
jgi:hypothetical protein